MQRTRVVAAVCVCFALVLAACDQNQVGPGDPELNPSTDGSIFAVTEDNTLIRFEASNPTAVQSVGSIDAGGEEVVGLDFRPATGNLFALTDGARLLLIDQNTAEATVVTENIVPDMGMLEGERIDIDFNPAANALRIVSDAGENLRIGPANLPGGEAGSGPAIIDGQFGYRQGVTAAAYTFPNPPRDRPEGTELFVIDTEEGVLYTQDANVGVLSRVGDLGIAGSIDMSSGYDIAEVGPEGSSVNEHYAVFTVDGASGFYGIDPESGNATLLASLPDGTYVGMLAQGEVPSDPNQRFVSALRENGDAYTLDFYSLDVTDGSLSDVGSVPVTGLPGGERIVGVDRRTTSMDPECDVGYALGSSGILYKLNCEGDPLTVAATEVAQLNNGNGNGNGVSLQGSVFGFDFNPRADLLRIVSNTGQNLRVNLEEGREIPGPDNGAEARPAGFTFIDGTVRLGDELPQAVGVAYRPEAMSIDGQVPDLDFQYIIDARDSSLGRVIVPNDGAILRVGSLDGAPTLPSNAPGAASQSLDISSDGVAFAALRGEGESLSTLYTVDLLSGATTSIGEIGGGQAVRAIAVELVD